MGRPRIPPVERTCDSCGVVFLIPRYRSEQCCSKKCAAVKSVKTREARYGPGWFRGANNPRFNNGLCTHKKRTMVCCLDGTVVWYSRVLLEGEIGRPLRPEEIVHHIDGDGTNDVVENLQIVTRSEHINIHRRELLAARSY